MYEYVAQFLRSPLWKIPILSFLDENCIIFDEGEENNEEHLQAHEVICHLDVSIIMIEFQETCTWANDRLDE